MGQTDQAKTRYQRDVAIQPSLGTINAIFATHRSDVGSFSSVMSMASKLELEEPP